MAVISGRCQRYLVPLNWDAPLALGAFYDTSMKPALDAVGSPAIRPARAAAVLWLTGAGGPVAPVHYMRVAQLLRHATHMVTLVILGLG